VRALGCLCVLLLLGGTCSLTSAADAGRGAEQKHVTAILLVAEDDLSDSDFADSVVLVMNNLGPAPVGVIVNRPTPITVAQLGAQLFPSLKQLAALHDKVYYGGPVELDSVWFLFRAAQAPERAVQALDDVYLSADRGLLLHLLSRDKPMDGLRIFVGHSGWAPGQLEAEIARGDWSLKRARSDAIFNGKPEHPWPAPQNPKNAA
jgi:putative transcriptional regulator